MLTPNNRTFLTLSSPTSIDDCWIDNTYPFLINTDLTDDQINTLIIGACGMVNTYLGSYLNEQTADQIIYNYPENNARYQTFTSDNSPLISITDVYLQILGQFTKVSLDYLEVFLDQGTFRILPYPEELTSLSINALNLANDKDISLWVRYVSGYSNVPEDIKMATAYMFNYMYNSTLDTASVKSFKTQTYSQTNAKPNEASNLLLAYSILDKYKPIHVA